MYIQRDLYYLYLYIFFYKYNLALLHFVNCPLVLEKQNTFKSCELFLYFMLANFFLNKL